jgi:hypothetical protein
MTRSKRDHGPRLGRREFIEGAASSGLFLAGPLTGRSAAQGGGRGPGQGRSGAAVAAALAAFAESLPAEARGRLVFPFSDEERFDWHFVPRPRKGVSFKNLGAVQREGADAVLRHGLSPGGYDKIQTIITLEDVLFEMSGRAYRDRELYFFKVFGEPGSAAPWGWSFEGHHISLNFTVANHRISSTPVFLGANPAEVRHGAHRGTRALAGEEDLARTLLSSLDAAQRKDALLSESAPADILTGNMRRASPLEPSGLAAGRLSGQQADALMELLKAYAATMPTEVATQRLENVRAGGLDRIRFAWAGGSERGQPHYYRVQGPGFLVEYDNIQNDANHIHTVWRDFEGDFGADLLAEHHRTAHRRA